jgi:hypothetical protein
MKLKKQVKTITTELMEFPSPYCVKIEQSHQMHCIYEMNGKTECLTITLEDADGDPFIVSGPFNISVHFPAGIPADAKEISYREFQGVLDNYVNHLIEITDRIVKGGNNE